MASLKSEPPGVSRDLEKLAGKVAPGLGHLLLEVADKSRTNAGPTLRYRRRKRP